MNRLHSFLDRRKFLALSLGAAATGCRREANVDASASRDRNDIPLRLLLVGSKQDGETIRRGWESISELPLQVQMIELDRRDPAAMATEVTERATQSDLLMYPLAVVAELDARDAITPLSDDDYQQIESDAGPLYASLRSGAARYSAKYVGVPQGAPQPALVTSQPLSTAVTDPSNKGSTADSPPAYFSWPQYDQWVNERWELMVAEPIAPGWAAAMFLWRAATNTSWLFDRESFEPLIGGDYYVEALEQMVTTNNAFRLDAVDSLKTLSQRTPTNIWKAVESGEIRAGIGFPDGQAMPEGNPVSIASIPQNGELPKVLLDPFSPIISISVNCRQTAAAKRFISWLSGGEGSDEVRRRIQGMTHLRPQGGSLRFDTNAEVPRGDNAMTPAASDDYHRFLTETLSTPLTLPTLQIRRGLEYYNALDKEVVKAIKGESTASEALAEAVTRWAAITREVGAEKQQRWWRRAQGMRG